MTNARDIRPLSTLNAAVRVPGSKSYTQRALIAAALARGESRIIGPLLSEDTQHLRAALGQLGVEIVSAGTGLVVKGMAGRLRPSGGELFLGNNGTAARFLLSVAALAPTDVTLSGDPRLCERPVRPLIRALSDLGVSCIPRGADGCLPVTIRGGGLRGGKTVFHDAESSQFISSILLSAPYANDDVTIEVSGTSVSRPYIDMTIDVMACFGVPVDYPQNSVYRVRGGRHYAGRLYEVEGDLSSASYFFLAAALGGTVRVENVTRSSGQGDVRLLAILESLGCRVISAEGGIEVSGGKLAEGAFEVDMGDCPDMVPTLAVLAALRCGRTVIRNVAHLRVKESDRLEALRNELLKTGVKAETFQDGIAVEGGGAHGAEIETYNDHRIAMSFAVLGLFVPGMKIRNPGCVAKSFPGFWDELEKLY